MFDFLTDTIFNGIEWLVVYVIIRGIFARWLSDKIRNHFIKTQRELAIWMHYQNKALNKGHKCKLRECDEDGCRLI